MGYGNVNNALACTYRLSKYRPDTDTLQLQATEALILVCMASKTFDLGQETEGRLPRYYVGGWRPIATTLGMLNIPDHVFSSDMDQWDKFKIAQRRENTAKSRISRAWVKLQEAGLIQKCQDAAANRNASFVLLIGTQDENQKVLARAREQIRQEQEERRRP